MADHIEGMYVLICKISKFRTKINKVLQKLKFSKNFNNEKCAPKMIFFNENFGYVIDFESQNFANC